MISLQQRDKEDKENSGQNAGKTELTLCHAAGPWPRVRLNQTLFLFVEKRTFFSFYEGAPDRQTDGTIDRPTDGPTLLQSKEQVSDERNCRWTDGRTLSVATKNPLLLIHTIVITFTFPGFGLLHSSKLFAMSLSSICDHHTPSLEDHQQSKTAHLGQETDPVAE